MLQKVGTKYAVNIAYGEPQHNLPAMYAEIISIYLQITLALPALLIDNGPTE